MRMDAWSRHFDSLFWWFQHQTCSWVFHPWTRVQTGMPSFKTDSKRMNWREREREGLLIREVSCGTQWWGILPELRSAQLLTELLLSSFFSRSFPPIYVLIRHIRFEGVDRKSFELSQLRWILSGLYVYLSWSTEDERIAHVSINEKVKPSGRWAADSNKKTMLSPF